VRTKVKQRLSLGTSKRQAILTAISSTKSLRTILDSPQLARRANSREGVRNSYWPRSRTLATQDGMTNDWLKTQGLISIRDLWMKALRFASPRHVLPSREPLR
jgi:RNA-directed DNA polymerase